jgi:hypothetical protein
MRVLRSRRVYAAEKSRLVPNANDGILLITFFAEIVFMLWLPIRGWKIREPPASLAVPAVF